MKIHTEAAKNNESILINEKGQYRLCHFVYMKGQ